MADPAAGISPAALDRVLEAAQAGAAAAMAFYHAAAIRVDCKTDESPVTAADRAAHAAICEYLANWDPGIPIVSEEATIPEYRDRLAWPRFWLIDPIDGTKEFLARNGEFTVNVALIEGHVPVLGAIVAPALDVAYMAGRGLGAWRLESGRTRVRLGLGAEVGARVRVVESRSHPSPRLEAFIATLGPVDRIRLGSSLKFCRIAEGAADVYARFGRTMEWDVAAGDCIIRSARPDGGVVCPAYNQPTLSIPEFIVGSRAICERAGAMQGAEL